MQRKVIHIIHRPALADRWAKNPSEGWDEAGTLFL
jgi:hypothetical protein